MKATPKKKQKKVVFAAHDGILYVKVMDVMSAMTMLIDGIAATRFGKTVTPYMTVDAAIEWADRESSESSKPEPYCNLAKNLRAAREQFRNGEMVEAKRKAKVT